MKEDCVKMFFGRLYIKNYHANYNSYFPLKVKGINIKRLLYYAQSMS